jgi:hypothetical protein
MTKARKVVLDSSEDRDHRTFGIFWDAFRYSYPKFARGFQGLQQANVIRKKLEAVSVPAANERDSTDRVLKNNGVMSLLFKSAEHEILLKMIENEDIGWTFVAGEYVEYAVEKLLKAESTEVEETEKKK